MPTTASESSSDLSTMVFATPRSLATDHDLRGRVGTTPAYLGPVNPNLNLNMYTSANSNLNLDNSDTWSRRATSDWSTVMSDDGEPVVPINHRSQVARPNMMTIADIMEAIESMRVSMADNFNMLFTLSEANTKYAEQGLTVGIAAKEAVETSKAETKAQLQDLRAQIQGVQDKVDGLDVDGRTRRRPA